MSDALKRESALAQQRMAQIEKRNMALPAVDWEIVDQRKIMPPDLQIIVGSESGVLRMSAHAWENVLPPDPNESPRKKNKSGRGRHIDDRAFVEQLDHYLDTWEYQGFSPSKKQEDGWTKWEVYAPAEPRWLLVIIGENHETGEHEIVTAYRMSDGALQNRLALMYLSRRRR